jgi:hypothetical protein
VLGVNSSAEGPVGTVVSPANDQGFITDIWYPVGVAADANGHIFLNSDSKGATILNTDGTVYEAYLGGTSLDTIPNAIAIDAFGGYWVPNGDESVIHVAADGTSVETTCCQTSWGVATDASHNVWIADYFGATFSEVDNNGTLVLNPASPGGGLQLPRYIAVDAGQNIWISNFVKSISEFAGNAGTLPAGTAISPTVGTGSGTAGGYGLDAGLNEPNSIAPDRSGNIWTSNTSGESVTMFFGLATPTVTPIQAVPTPP